jgi:hypothetical protein
MRWEKGGRETNSGAKIGRGGRNVPMLLYLYKCGKPDAADSEYVSTAN